MTEKTILNIYEARDGWFLQGMADAIKKYCPDDILIRSVYCNDPEIYPDGVNFFCNMGIYETYLAKTSARPSRRDVIMTTHIEKWRLWDVKYKKPYYMPVTLIALIGRLYPSGRKGEKWLKPLLREVGKDFDWLIIGQRWEKFLKDRFFGRFNISYRESPSKEEYHSLFNEFDIFLSLSKIEGGPMPLVESMAAGIVPVVSDTGFAEEIIKEGESGYIYPAGDIGKLSEILMSLRKEDLKKYSAQAKDAVKDVTWENFVGKVMGVIKRTGQLT